MPINKQISTEELLYTLIEESTEIQVCMANIVPHQVEQVKKMLVQKIIHYISEFNRLLKSNRRIDVFKKIMGLMDQEINNMSEKEKLAVSCKRGCSFCCHINVEITEDEGDVIGEHCKNHNIPIDKEYLLNQLKIPELEIAFAENSACVFLKNGECSIYDVRPLICRKYLVATPAEKCDTKKYPLYKVGGLVNLDPESVMAAVAFIVFQGGKPDRMPKILLKYAK